VRCTCNETEAAEGLAQIVPRSPVPIIADIHHQYKMALAAMEAGVHGLRLNPGNIRKPEHIKAVAAEARTVASRSASASTPVRSTRRSTRSTAAVTPEAMVESAQQEIAYFDEVGFDRHQDLGQGVERAADGRGLPPAAEVTDHPLHLGVTEAGPPPAA
jgi:(E)-4-hydroxy-3-methylbut-2-enyl-diphosphate synthase